MANQIPIFSPRPCTHPGCTTEYTPTKKQNNFSGRLQLGAGQVEQIPESVTYFGTCKNGHIVKETVPIT